MSHFKVLICREIKKKMEKNFPETITVTLFSIIETRASKITVSLVFVFLFSYLLFLSRQRDIQFSLFYQMSIATSLLRNTTMNKNRITKYGI